MTLSFLVIASIATSLQTANDYIFTRPETNVSITGKILMSMPRSEDVLFLAEGYTERLFKTGHDTNEVSRIKREVVSEIHTRHPLDFYGTRNEVNYSHLLSALPEINERSFITNKIYRLEWNDIFKNSSLHILPPNRFGFMTNINVSGYVHIAPSTKSIRRAAETLCKTNFLGVFGRDIRFSNVTNLIHFTKEFWVVWDYDYTSVTRYEFGGRTFSYPNRITQTDYDESGINRRYEFDSLRATFTRQIEKIWPYTGKVSAIDERGDPTSYTSIPIGSSFTITDRNVISLPEFGDVLFSSRQVSTNVLSTFLIPSTADLEDDGSSAVALVSRWKVNEAESRRSVRGLENDYSSTNNVYYYVTVLKTKASLVNASTGTWKTKADLFDVFYEFYYGYLGCKYDNMTVSVPTPATPGGDHNFMNGLNREVHEKYVEITSEVEVHVFWNNEWHAYILSERNNQ